MRKRTLISIHSIITDGYFRLSQRKNAGTPMTIHLYYLILNDTRTIFFIN
jgi:hypothetical protein